MRYMLPCSSVCLLVLISVGTYGRSDTDIFNFTLPINLTSWRISLHEAFNRSSAKSLSLGAAAALNDTLAWLRNGSVGCTPQGAECIPEVPSCCPSTVSGHYGSVEDEDLQCLPGDGVYRCTALTDSWDVAGQRLNALEYGDSAGQLQSHPWVDSWEFQSRSEAEREELQALQEEEWKKNFKPSEQENAWVKLYNKIKKEALDAWKDLRKMKKLKEVKDSLLDKKRKKSEPTVPPVEQEGSVSRAPARVLYPDEVSGEAPDDKARTGEESEESMIKFSDELPKRGKKIDFRIDDIIKDAIDLAGRKFEKPTKQGQPLEKGSAVPSVASEEELLRLDEIQGTVDKLMKEVNDLKAPKTRQDDMENQKDGVLNKLTGPHIDDLIKKHVHNILEEKRRLYELRKIEESKRLKLEGFKT